MSILETETPRVRILANMIWAICGLWNTGLGHGFKLVWPCTYIA